MRYCRTIASLFSTLSCTRRLGENMAERNAVSVFYLIPHMSLKFSFSFIFIFQFKCVNYLFNNSSILFLENNGSLVLQLYSFHGIGWSDFVRFFFFLYKNIKSPSCFFSWRRHFDKFCTLNGHKGISMLLWKKIWNLKRWLLYFIYSYFWKGFRSTLKLYLVLNNFSLVFILMR